MNELPEWYIGPLHPPSLAKSLPTRRKGRLPLTDENHPAWNQEKNAVALQNLPFESTYAPALEKRKNNE